MDWKYDKWLEFRELWESSDPESRQIYLIRSQALHDYIRDAAYFKLMMHWNKDAESISVSYSRKIFLYTALSTVLIICAILSSGKLAGAAFTAIAAVVIINLVINIFNNAVLDIKNYNLSFQNQLHIEKRNYLYEFLDSVNIDSILYVSENRYLAEKSQSGEQYEEYKKCFVYYQNLHIEILKKSQINNEPNIFPI